MADTVIPFARLETVHRRELVEYMGKLVPPLRQPSSNTPWKFEPADNFRAAVFNHDGEVIFFTTPGVAALATTSVNSHIDMVARYTDLEHIAREVHAVLRPIYRTSPRLTEAYRALDEYLFPGM